MLKQALISLLMLSTLPVHAQQGQTAQKPSLYYKLLHPVGKALRSMAGPQYMKPQDFPTSQVPPALQNRMGTGNIFGGQNYYGPNGQLTTTMPNMMGGENIQYPNGGYGATTSNMMGGYNYLGSNGSTWTSSRNIFGGQNVIGPKGQLTTTMPTMGGGFTSYGPNGRVENYTPNMMGGFNKFP